MTDHAWYWTQATGLIRLAELAGGTTSEALGVSADGLTVVGYSDDATGHIHAVVWPNLGAPVNLGELAGGLTSVARGISADGTTIVGDSHTGTNPVTGQSDSTACYWRNQAAPVALSKLNAGTWAQAYAANTNGSVIVGTAADGSDSGHQKAVSWTSGVIANIGPTGTSSVFGLAYAVDGAGDVITGNANMASPPNISNEQAFRWTSGGGMVGEGLISGGFFSAAQGIDAGGTILAGVGDAADGHNHAFRWTSGGGYVTQANYSTGNAANGEGISSNGVRIVGSASGGGLSNSHAVYWDSNGAAVFLGFLPGGTYSIARAASSDGSTIVGYGDYSLPPSGLACGVARSTSNLSVVWQPPSVGAPTSYNVRYQLAGAATWTEIDGITTTETFLTGLAPGQFYTIEVASVVGTSASAWSDPITCGTASDLVTDGAGSAPPVLTPVPLSYDDRRTVINTAWTVPGQICILQLYPMPVTITATIPEVEVGDTPSQ